jgi:hypothetical protein
VCGTGGGMSHGGVPVPYGLTLGGMSHGGVWVTEGSGEVCRVT